jgi:hypothetical protein
VSVTEHPWWRERVRQDGDCLLWTMTLDRDGYGKCSRDGRYWRAPRLAHEDFIGPIPEGLEIDHLCRNPQCVNPYHLEAVTGRENRRRGDGFAGRQSRREECIHGHPLSGDNLYMHDGHRYCRTCRRATWNRLNRAGLLPSKRKAVA